MARRAGGMIPSRQDCPFASVSYKLTFLFIYSRLSISLGSFAAWQCCGQCWAVLRNMSHAGSESDDAVEADPYARTYIAVAPLCVALSLPSRVYIYILYLTCRLPKVDLSVTQKWYIPLKWYIYQF